ncbi:MAG: PAS domain S-box protein [Xanthobacteraceae bacterium]|jgi:PAS domain S-box-containing protein
MTSEQDPNLDLAGLPRAELWRLCLDAAPAGIAMFDRDMRYIAVNRRYRDNLKLGEQSLLGRSHYDVFPDIPERWREIHRRCLAGDSAGEEADAFIRADGSTEWYRWLIRPWRNKDAAIGGIVLFVENVTERVAADTERRQLADAFANAAVGMIIGNPENGTIRFANPAYAAMRGMTVEEVVGTPIVEAYCVEERSRRAGLLATADAVGQVVFNTLFRRKDGSTVPVQVCLTSVREIDGNVRYRMSNVIDISEQEHTEAMLRQAQKMEAVGQLTGGVAHDFNNLLTVVIGNLDTLVNERSDDPLVRELGLVSLAAAERGAQLTQQLLAFSRRQPLQPQLLDPNALIANFAGLFARTLGERIGVETVLGADIWPVYVDRAQLEAALVNLATNARDAMPNGGRLTLRTTNCRHTAKDARRMPELPPGNYTVIVAEDTGTGISADALPHIFEPFFTTKEVGQGTGLGLSMIYGFVKQSGGHITAESKPTATTFRIYLPRAPTSETKSKEHVASVPQASGKTVLVVEDDAAVRRVMVAQLGKLGCRVLEAANAAAGLSLLEQNDVDVLVTDVVMPGEMNGRELARRARRRWPKLHVLLMSGYPDGDRDGQTEEHLHLLAKPFRASQLKQALQRVIAQGA